MDEAPVSTAPPPAPISQEILCLKDYDLADEFKFGIDDQIYQADSRYENESLHRSGRPRIVSESLRRRLLHEVRANSKIRYKDLRLNLGLDGKAVSKTTLYRILKKEGITN